MDRGDSRLDLVCAKLDKQRVKTAKSALGGRGRRAAGATMQNDGSHILLLN